MDQAGNICRCNCHITFCGKEPEWKCYCDCNTIEKTHSGFVKRLIDNLAEADAKIAELELMLVNYNKLLDLVKKCKNHSCCLCDNYCMACGAYELLKEIDKVDNK